VNFHSTLLHPPLLYHVNAITDNKLLQATGEILKFKKSFIERKISGSNFYCIAFTMIFIKSDPKFPKKSNCYMYCMYVWFHLWMGQN
jgi:hypothetical protein